jgi:hypothetical protein
MLKILFLQNDLSKKGDLMAEYFSEEFYENLLKRKHAEMKVRLIDYILLRKPVGTPTGTLSWLEDDRLEYIEHECIFGCERHGLLVNCDEDVEVDRIKSIVLDKMTADPINEFEILRKKFFVNGSKRKLKKSIVSEEFELIEDLYSKLSAKYDTFVKKKLTLDGLKRAASGCTKQCKYCELSYEDIHFLWVSGAFTFDMNQPGPTLDRIDPKKEYSDDNITFCCMACNLMKGDAFTESEFLDVVKVVARIKKENLKAITDTLEEARQKEIRIADRKARKMLERECTPYDPMEDF